MLKILKWGLIGLGGLIVLAATVLYGGSELVIRKTYSPPQSAIAVSLDPAAVARGAHLGRTRGCDGCHGRDLKGEVFIAEPAVGTLYTANLTRAIPAYSDAELARAIRSGVAHDGRSLWAMPAGFSQLTDRDTADIIAWLRSHPAAGEAHPRPSFGPLGRLGILMGKFQATPREIELGRATPALDAGAAFAPGRYIAMTTCGDCHGTELKGANEVGPAPDLMIAASYDLPLFTRFMRTGVAMDGKTKGMMSEVARDEFSAFTDQEIADLHAYLTARAERMPEPTGS